MDLDEYQKKAVITDCYTDNRDCALGFLSEAGEVASKISKSYRDGGNGNLSRNLGLAYELGDALWGIAALADRYGMRLDDIAQMNIEKLADRKKRDVIKGEGDYR